MSGAGIQVKENGEYMKDLAESIAERRCDELVKGGRMEAVNNGDLAEETCVTGPTTDAKKMRMTWVVCKAPGSSALVKLRQ